MNSINFNNEEDFNRSVIYYSEGFESKLYRYIDGNQEVLIKKYYDEDQVNIDKIKKISNLKTNELLKPQSLLKVGNETIGFTMDFVRGLYPLSVEKNDLSNLQKYNLIMKLKQILLSLKSEGCIYGDLNVNNVLTDGNQVYLCDSVNVKIDNYSFDEISSTMRNYIDRTGTIDNIECYMLNLLTVYFFNEIDYDSVIENVELSIRSMFNKESLDNLIGVTDSLEILNMCCSIFLSNQPCDKFLIDYMDINKINFECKHSII